MLKLLWVPRQNVCTVSGKHDESDENEEKYQLRDY